MSEHTDDASPRAGDDAPRAPAPADATDPKALRALVRWVAVEVFVYIVIALVLIFLALRRGRLSDAILVTLTVLFTTPMLLGYRQQALDRLRGGRGKPADAPAASSASDPDASVAPADGDGAPPPPSAG